MPRLDEKAEAELRAETSFEPLGASFLSCELDVSRPGRIRVKPSRMGMPVVFFVILILFAVAVSVAGRGGWRQGLSGLVFPVFCLIAVFALLRRSAVFDFYSGSFVRGWKKIPLGRIAALQAIEKIRSLKGRSFRLWELDLVLDDAERIFVFERMDSAGFQRDVELLSGRLDRPVWRKEADPSSDLPVPDGGKPGTGTSLRGGVIAGLFFLILPLIFGIVFLVPPLCHAAASADWKECPAVVVESRLESFRGSKGGTTYKIRILAEYVWEGRKYQCEKYDFFRSAFSSNFGVKEMRRIVQEHPPGAKITCLVDPADPSESVISREIPLMCVLPLSLFLLLLFSVGVFLLTFAAGKFLKNRADPQGKKS